jgi:hypothetical protein
MSYGFLRRWQASSRSAVILEIRHRRRYDQSDIAPGWNVVDLDGQAVGQVRAIESGWLTIDRGFLRRSFFVPISSIHEVTFGTVRLAAHTGEMDGSWTHRPSSDRPK